MAKLLSFSSRFGSIVVCLLFLGLLSQQALADSYEEGRRAYITGNYEKALEILKPLAEAGDSGAQKIMGIMYDYGQGVDKDPRQALYWYTLSANQGDPAVQYQVGAKYFRGDGIEQNYQEAARWWELSAAGGQVDAQFNLGLMYYRGLNMQQDINRAAELFRQAAEQGHSYAQYSLAVMYSFGQGVEKDYTSALQWFRKSADQGVAQAQFNMGVYYENGFGVDKDLAEAKVWYERASAQGLEEAKEKITSLESVKKKTEKSSDMEYSIEEIATTTIRREDWVMQQKPDSYTLQIGSVLKEQDIINFIKQNKLESDAAYIRVIINDVTRYNALYGVYENYDQAQLALDKLPDNLRKVKPWIRNFSVLQSMIK